MAFVSGVREWDIRTKGAIEVLTTSVGFVRGILGTRGVRVLFSRLQTPDARKSCSRAKWKD